MVVVVVVVIGVVAMPDTVLNDPKTQKFIYNPIGKLWSFKRKTQKICNNHCFNMPG